MADEISFLEEIDESLRVEKLEAFWRQSGKWVIAACVAVLLFTAGSVLWKGHVRTANEKQTDLLLAADALAGEGKTAEAEAAFHDAEKGDRNLATLAKLREAEILTDAGNKEKALAVYNAVAADSFADKGLRDLARMRADILADNSGKGASAVADNTTFKGLTHEVAALDLMKAGKNAEARSLLTPVVQDNTLPQSQRLRALELLDTLPEEKK